MPDVLNISANERIDLADLTYATSTSQLGFQRVPTSNFMLNPAGQQLWVVNGFGMSNPSMTNQVQVAIGTAMLAYRVGSNVYNGVVSAEGAATQAVDLTTFTAGVYGIYISFNYIPGGNGSRTFWNPTSPGSEYSQSTPTRLTATWVVRVEIGSPGSEWLQIGSVTWTGSAITITDMRPFYFEGRVDLPDYTLSTNFTAYAYAGNVLTGLSSVAGYTGSGVTGSNIPANTTIVSIFSTIGLPGGGTTSGSNQLTGTSSSALVGQAVSGTNIPTGTYIVSISGTTATLNNVATATGTVTVTYASSVVLSATPTSYSTTSATYALQTNQTGTNYPQTWGSGTNDRSSNRATYGIGDFQTWTQAMRTCLEDIKGVGLARWYTPYVAGQTIGYQGTPLLSRTTWNDAAFYMQGSTSVPSIGWGGTASGIQQYTRSTNSWQWILNSTAVANLNSSGLSFFGAAPGNTLYALAASYSAANTTTGYALYKTSTTLGCVVGYGTTSGTGTGIGIGMTTATSGTVTTGVPAYVSGGFLNQSAADNFYFMAASQAAGYIGTGTQWFFGNFVGAPPGITTGVINSQTATLMPTATFSANSNARIDNQIIMSTYATNQNTIVFQNGTNGATASSAFAQNVSATQYGLYDYFNGISFLKYTAATELLDVSPTALFQVNNLAQTSKTVSVHSCPLDWNLNNWTLSGQGTTTGSYALINTTNASAVISISLRAFAGTPATLRVIYATGTVGFSGNFALYYRYANQTANSGTTLVGAGNASLNFAANQSYTVLSTSLTSPSAIPTSPGGGNAGVMITASLTIPSPSTTGGLQILGIVVDFTVGNIVFTV